jgi:hypothetical protein
VAFNIVESVAVALKRQLTKIKGIYERKTDKAASEIVSIKK